MIRPIATAALLTVLLLSPQAQASEKTEQLAGLLHKAMNAVVADWIPAGAPTETSSSRVDANRLPMTASPSQLYFPLNNGDSKTYRYSSYTSTMNYTQTFFAGRACFKETDSLDGSIAYFGHETGRLVIYGFGLPGYGDFTLSNPLTIITDSIISNGGSVPQSSATVTFQGMQITVKLNISVSVRHQIVLPIGTTADCRSLTWTMDLIEPGYSEPSITLKDAWVLAPNLGKVQIAIMAQNQYGIMYQLGWMDITSGRVGGVDVAALLAPPPLASFSASPLAGPAPLAVQFTDMSTGNISGWSWNFGDGTTSAQQHPYHIYTTAGSYTISLTVSGNSGSDTVTKITHIKVATPVAANFSALPVIGIAPLAVSFSDRSSGDISNWSWSFGDGTTSSLKNPSHTYAAAGIYSISLTVSGAGGTDTITRNSLVRVAAPAVADFSASPTVGMPPLPVAFTDLSSGDVANRSWSFGDGATSNLADPVHTFTSPGSYMVSLVASGEGGSDRKSVANFVRVAHPGADVNRDGSVTLTDALLVLRIMTGGSVALPPVDDIDGDHLPGLAEARYLLNFLSLSPSVQQ